jgi:hypothetical protein
MIASLQNMGGIIMAKRKAEFNAVEKYSKTPRKNRQEGDFSAEFAQGEDPIKGANRNSKLGRKGRS